MAKGLDKIETMLQHLIGANPPDFDYRFNLTYGRQITDCVTDRRQQLLGRGRCGEHVPMVHSELMDPLEHFRLFTLDAIHVAPPFADDGAAASGPES
jgi:hypothetical protein